LKYPELFNIISNYKKSFDMDVKANSLEKEVEDLTTKCNSDFIFKLSNQAKDKILDLSKRLETTITETSTKCISFKLKLIKI
jgi:hypothetical protein